MTETTEPIRVLHVDDQPDFADMAATFVEREDDRIVVRTATSASEGVERLAGEAFDCIVSDYEMPGQNGLDFLETVREEYPDLPFILYMIRAEAHDFSRGRMSSSDSVETGSRGRTRPSA